MSDPTLDRLRLARTEGVGPVTYRRLMAQYGTAAEAIAALPEIARAGGRATPPPVPHARDAARELDRLHRAGGRMVFVGDAEYPPMMALCRTRRRCSPSSATWAPCMAARSGWWARATRLPTASAWPSRWPPTWR